MRKKIFIIFVVISLILLILRLASVRINEYIASTERSGVRVDSNPGGVVYIDSKEWGKTPYQKEDLKKGDHLVEVRGEALSWKGYVKLNPGTLTVVNRDLNQSSISASGETISLEKGKGVIVISNPTGADVEIDGTLKGQTPMQIGDLVAGEHQFILSKADFTSRSIRSVITDGYKLNMNVDLAVSEIDITKTPTVPIQTVQQVKVLSTPVGFLRVRAEADVNSEEVGRVSPGDKLPLLSEVSGWKKVRLSDGKEGFVSSQYVEKVTE